jgi:O-antigen ligase
VALFQIIRSVWLFAADILPVLAAAFLPWSTSAVSVVLAVWLIFLIPAIDYKAFVRSLAQPACWLPIALFALAVAGMFWAEGPWRDRFLGLSPVFRLFLLPLLFDYFAHSKRSAWLLWAFVLSSALLMIFSWVVLFEPHWRFTRGDVAGAPVKNSIDQSYEFVICIFALAPVALTLFEKRRLAAFAACAALIIAFLANLVFVVTSRTVVFYMPILLVLFACRHFSIRSTTIFISTAAVAAIFIWSSSSYLRERVEQIGVEYREYQEMNRATSTGERLAYWKESIEWIKAAPLIGYGTGSTKQLFNAAAIGKDGGWADRIRNPHNQALYVTIQWGALGCIILFAMWCVHARLFLGPGVVAWIGFAIVAQNILSSLLNSHLFDFTEGWIYVLGVGVTGGIERKRRRYFETNSSKLGVEQPAVAL